MELGLKGCRRLEGNKVRNQKRTRLLCSGESRVDKALNIHTILEARQRSCSISHRDYLLVYVGRTEDMIGWNETYRTPHFVVDNRGVKDQERGFLSFVHFYVGGVPV